MGRRRLRHPQHRLAAGAARAGPGAGGGAGRDPRVARGVPLDAADPARVGVRRLGVGLASAATTPARSASSRACAARRRTAGPATSSAEIGRWSPRASARSRCSGRTSTRTAWSSATGRRSRKLLRACGEIEGLERVRFTSPAPGGVHRRRDRGDGRDAERDAAAAHAAAVRLRPGAARRCGAPTARRSTSASSSGSAPRCPTPRSPPTSSSASPARPRRTSRRPSTSCARRASPAAFTFQYSKRPGTPAADAAPTRSPPAVVQDRYERLVALVNEIAWEENKALVGRTVELMVAEGEGRKDAATHRLSGRARDNRLVHFAPDLEAEATTSARATWSPSRSPTPPRTTWSPTARSSPSAVPAPATPGRRAPRSRPPSGVSLGMPTLGVPAPLPDAPACR